MQPRFLCMRFSDGRRIGFPQVIREKEDGEIEWIWWVNPKQWKTPEMLIYCLQSIEADFAYCGRNVWALHESVERAAAYHAYHQELQRLHSIGNG